MTNILFITQYLRPNGTEKFMMNVFHNIDKTRFNIDFLLFTEEETIYTQEVRDNGGKIHILPNRKETPKKYYQELNLFFYKHKDEYQAVHFCGGSLTSIAPLYFAWKYKIPVRIAHSHSSYAHGLHNKILHCINRLGIYKIATHHLACSDLAAKWFFGKGPSKVVNNGIDVESFRYNENVRNEMRKTQGINQDAFVIGHVGRFSSEKNHTFLIDVFQEIHKTNNKAILILVGIGELLEEIKNKVNRLGLSQNVLFLGLRQDVNRLMQAMDCFVMPSTFEGLPFVLVEAQCAGLPCYVSDNVSKKSALLPSTKFFSLTTPAKLWAQEISAIGLVANRACGAEEIISQGYSISGIIDSLQTIYTSYKK